MIKLLVRERKRSGLSQTELAMAAGFRQPDISRVERFERRLDIVELADLIQAIALRSSRPKDEIWREVNANLH